MKNVVLRGEWSRDVKAIVSYSYYFGAKNGALSLKNTYFGDLYS